MVFYPEGNSSLNLRRATQAPPRSPAGKSRAVRKATAPKAEPKKPASKRAAPARKAAAAGKATGSPHAAEGPAGAAAKMSPPAKVAAPLRDRCRCRAVADSVLQRRPGRPRKAAV